MKNLFDAERFRKRVEKAVETAGSARAVANASHVDESVISRILSGEYGCRRTETYFRLMFYMTGKKPPQ